MLEKNFGSQTFGLVLAWAFAQIAEERRGEIRTSTKVESISEIGYGVEIGTNRGTYRARKLVDCAGLYSDRLAEMSGVDPGMKSVPFPRGVLRARPRETAPVKEPHLPGPQPELPGPQGPLHPHGSRGGMEAGPNAALGAAREGYKKTDINLRLDFGHL